MPSFISQKRNSINVQIIVAFSTLLVIIVVLQLFGYYWINKLPAINELKLDFSKLQKEQLLLKSAANEFILKEQSNENFFATGESQYLQQYAKALADLQQSVDQIQQKGNDLQLEDTGELKRLRQAIAEYNQLFVAMVDKIKTRGYGRHGLIGEFDKTMMDLMVYDFGEDNVAVLNLKLFVKEYLLTGDQEATKNVSDEIYNFSVVLEKYIRDDQVEVVGETLGRYERVFSQLVEIDKELGLYSTQGLQGNLFSAMNEIDRIIGLKETNNRIEETSRAITNGIYISFIFVIAAAFIAALLISIRLFRNIVVPINKIKSVIVQMGHGEIPEKMSSFKMADVNDMALAVNSLISGMHDHHEFANNIGKGNLEATFTLLNQNDVLGVALLNMRDNLKKIQEESRQRNWVTQGIAQFGALLRDHSNDLRNLGDRIVSQLVKYLDVNQAGLYLVNDEDPGDVHMYLLSCYAYERKKFIEQRINLGEGLLGQCILEKNTLYLTNLPPSYFKITSGLGHAVPRVLLIIPLQQNSKVFGALELASFHDVEPHKRELAEKVAESIAATISTVKTNERNRKLLEVSQEQTHIMKQQEEEMRQQVEELQATQEQMRRNLRV
jgi:hypothetical protein